MTPQFLAKIARRTAKEVIASVPLGPGVTDRMTIAAEMAMNEEWWRGYYAGRGVVDSTAPKQPDLTGI